MFWGTPFERFMFDPELVRQGEWWRLFAFPIPSGMENPIFALLYGLYVYYVFNALESSWGAAPLTIFVILGYIAGLVASFITGAQLSIWLYIIENVSLA